MRYLITAQDGTDVEVHAVDWMMAMTKAIAHFGIEAGGWVCESRLNGETLVIDSSSGLSWVVQPLHERAPVARSAKAKGGPPPVPSFLKGRSTTLSAPVPSRPAPPSFERAAPVVASGPPAGLAERLFDVTMDISSAANGNEACRVALDIALNLITCEAGSVLRGGLNQSSLQFVAVSGPAASQLMGREVPFGQGIVGACFDLGINIQLNDAQADRRHCDSFDQETGFQTRGVLCVPIRTDESFFGCIQLLNPPGQFERWHMDVVETLAQSLGNTLEAST